MPKEMLFMKASNANLQTARVFNVATTGNATSKFRFNIVSFRGNIVYRNIVNFIGVEDWQSVTQSVNVI